MRKILIDPGISMSVQAWRFQKMTIAGLGIVVEAVASPVAGFTRSNRDVHSEPAPTAP
jgi:hypothetical protein